jgi:hypothetical protein
MGAAGVETVTILITDLVGSTGLESSVNGAYDDAVTRGTRASE